MKQEIRIGSRASRLAVTQSEWVGAALKEKNPALAITYVHMKTEGDKDLSSSLQSLGGKGVFVKEIETALLKNEIDLAVHSLKDVPQTLPPGLRLGATPKREDQRDAVISRFGEQLNELPRGSTIGTSSPRRQAQIRYRYPKKQYRLEPLRGNVETRIKKLQDGEYDSIVLALAGVRRLGLENEIHQIMELDELMPAPGQGALGLEHRIEDEATKELIESIRHDESDIRSRAERAFLQALGGNCLIPLGAYAVVTNDEIRMVGQLLDMKGERSIRVEERGSAHEPELVGAKLAGRLLFEGGSEIMMELESPLP
jgi:hydroxymethylbilane synthase